jgi:hypothetical protein
LKFVVVDVSKYTFLIEKTKRFIMTEFPLIFDKLIVVIGAKNFRID